jgi:hypothetical protein
MLKHNKILAHPADRRPAPLPPLIILRQAGAPIYTLFKRRTFVR